MELDFKPLEALQKSAIADTNDRRLQLIETVNRAMIENEQDFGNLGDVRKVIKSEISKLEEARKKLVKPLNDHVKMINGEFAKAKQPLEIADELGNKKQVAFAKAERERREEEERRRREEEELAALKLAEEQEQIRKQAEEEAKKAAESGDSAAEAMAKEMAEKAKEESEKVLSQAADAPKPDTNVRKARGYFGSSTSARETWSVSLIDLKSLPSAYFDLIMQNEKAKEAIVIAIKKAVIDDMKIHSETNKDYRIPGLKVEKVLGVIVR